MSKEGGVPIDRLDSEWVVRYGLRPEAKGKRLVVSTDFYDLACRCPHVRRCVDAGRCLIGMVSADDFEDVPRR